MRKFEFLYGNKDFFRNFKLISCFLLVLFITLGLSGYTSIVLAENQCYNQSYFNGILKSWDGESGEVSSGTFSNCSSCISDLSNTESTHGTDGTTKTVCVLNKYNRYEYFLIFNDSVSKYPNYFFANNVYTGVGLTPNEPTPTPKPIQPPTKPTISITQNIAPAGTNIQLSFPLVPNATSYKLCYGTASGNYSSGCMNITSPLSLKIQDNWDLYVALKAVNGHVESDYSNEVNIVAKDKDLCATVIDGEKITIPYVALGDGFSTKIFFSVDFRYVGTSNNGNPLFKLVKYNEINNNLYYSSCEDYSYVYASDDLLNLGFLVYIEPSVNAYLYRIPDPKDNNSYLFEFIDTI